MFETVWVVHRANIPSAGEVRGSKLTKKKDLVGGDWNMAFTYYIFTYYFFLNQQT